MRIALISDIHGNEVALEAVLNDIKQAGADQIVCLGDIVALGPLPVSVLQMIQDLACPCVLGNHDAFMIDPPLIHTYTDVPVIVDSVEWCRAQLSTKDLEFIRTFPTCMEINYSNENKLVCFHGSPRDHMENILSTTPGDEVEQMLAGHTSMVMAGGHTHVQMLRQHKGNLIVNPGSVGFPFKEFVYDRPPEIMAHAEYAIVTMEQKQVDVSLRRVPFCQKALKKSIERDKSPVQELLLRQA